IRIDFFGDEIEGIRSFDPLTQKTSGKVDAFEVFPVSEITLSDESVARFRAGYREEFGAAKDDPLYEAISANRSFGGMEHWLPLFEPSMVTLFDFLPDDTLISVDEQVDAEITSRLATVNEYYQSRREILEGTHLSDRGQTYKPLTPNKLYCEAEEMEQLLTHHKVMKFSAFSAPELAGKDKDASQTAIIDVKARPGQDFAEGRRTSDRHVVDFVIDAVSEHHNAGRVVLVSGHTTGTIDRLRNIFREHGFTETEVVADWKAAQELPKSSLGLAAIGIERGYVADDHAVITEEDIFGARLVRPTRQRKRKAEEFMAELNSLSSGDCVVHIDHGIGRYQGLEVLDVGGAPHDCARIDYDGGDKLYVPVENLDVISRYGASEGTVHLDKLGGAAWQSKKARVKKRIRDIAEELLKVAAERQLKKGDVVTLPEGLYDEFAAKFPYAETDDQLRAITEVLEDMASGRPMDRLVCGDVGFGKTEVALRAAFVAAMSGMQVALVVPTTLLARQHYKTLVERFKGLPVKIGQLSRMVTPKQAAATKAELAEGRCDIVVGTHALLSKSIQFKQLGLLIIDEEQHFGVKQKERMKQLRADVHVLTLTATPIPRTLQQAMSGIREMSLIATPPVDRLAVRTFVFEYDPMVIREAILREHKRGGQVFYVCPRIEDLDRVSERLAKLVPECTTIMAHGQMPADQLDKIMNAFYDGAFDILLSTNIVESGLDIPTANTLIIHRSEMFGLAQLYQLRGRVGRSKARAYAYLTLPQGRVITTTARRRLEVMQTLDTLGAGFSLASYDLDIRGAGNLLGEEQSGHIKEVGVELYQQMLEEAVANAQKDGLDTVDREWTPQINLSVPVMIPDAYVADLNIRLGLYRRLADLRERRDVDEFAAELIDRFGAVPHEVENLLQVITLKIYCRKAGIEKVEAGPKGAVVSFRNNAFAKPDALISFIQQQAGRVQIRPDQKLVYRRDWTALDKRVIGVRRLVSAIAKLAA
ncbi:MAG: transcription-repair coupling factor, partial [Pseudomonadota bacterium]